MKKINILDSDWVVLLSRWDVVFSRVLREAIKNNLPIIASKETHFHDLINRYSIGVCYHGNLSQLETDINLFDRNKANFKGAIGGNKQMRKTLAYILYFIIGGYIVLNREYQVYQ